MALNMDVTKQCPAGEKEMATRKQYLIGPSPESPLLNNWHEYAGHEISSINSWKKESGKQDYARMASSIVGSTTVGTKHLPASTGLALTYAN